MPDKKSQQKTFILFLGAGVTLIFLVMLFFSQSKATDPQVRLPLLNQPTPSPTSKPVVKIGEREISVELADTPDTRRIGLGNTQNLTDDEGMLFVFDREDVWFPFWMKGMSMPIDIIWIDDGKVIYINEEVEPEPGKSDSSLTKYSPNASFDYVLEVASGFSKRNSITVGSQFVR